MNSNDQRDLEQYIDAELKGLPHVKAPSDLRAQVLSRIAAKAPVPVRSAQWSIGARAALFAGLALFVSCLAWILVYLPGNAPAAQWLDPVSDTLKYATLALAVVKTLLEAALTILRNLGTPATIALITIAGVSYLACVGLGTVCYRLAFTPTRNSQYS